MWTIANDSLKAVSINREIITLWIQSRNHSISFIQHGSYANVKITNSTPSKLNFELVGKGGHSIGKPRQDI